MPSKTPIKKPKTLDPKLWRNLIWMFLVGLLAASVFSAYFNQDKAPTEYAYSQFLNELDNGNIKSVTIRSSEKVLVGKTNDGKSFRSQYVDSPELVPKLREKNVTFRVNPAASGRLWGVLFQAFLPFLLIALLWFFIFRQAQGSNSQAMSFGKSKATLWKKDQKQNITFSDVAGVDEAVEELREIVDFLKNPARYIEIGAKIPKGALLMGPPGTGKTLLAKAIAGEADVPFFSLSGSDFVEMFVGVGASRVRDLFVQAKKAQPCIIFLDEIDAVGRHRGAGLGGGHDEREQTLNQLLVEMDGFDGKHTVIVIAATNRPDILDPALQRPGRFDRQIVVDKPDVKGRLAILAIHAKNIKLATEVDLQTIAKRTPGFTGADLANLMNEAALLAARRGKKEVSMSDVEEATDRLMAGPARKSRSMSDKEKEIVAYHEVGHAIVAKLAPNSDPVHKISILPRGMALGYTLQLPSEDRYLMSRVQIEEQIMVLMGGRIAESLIFNEITSGASNDIERATDIARGYVCKYGMDLKLGSRKYGKSQGAVFLGRELNDHSKDYSEATAALIDEAIHGLIERCYKQAEAVLTRHRSDLVRVAKHLMEHEVIEGVMFDRLMDLKADNIVAFEVV